MERSHSPRWRRLRASLRDAYLLLREFSWPLLAFVIAIIGGGILYTALAKLAGEPLQNHLEGIYQILSLTFLNPQNDFPKAWYLEIFYFVMPIIGTILIAQGVTEFGVMLFNKRARAREWEMAVASTLRNHHILIGLGHLGYRVATSLHDLDQDLVVIELNPSADLVANIKRLGVPVIQDDASRESTLEAAGVRSASTIVLCTQKDSLNLQIALKARRMNPDIRVVVRIFDNEFASALQEQFGFIALSATEMAAPAFASAAAGVDITRPITIEGETMSLARLKLMPDAPLTRMSVGDLEKHYNLSVVLLRRDGSSDLHPAGEIMLMGNDNLGIIGGITEISALVHDNTIQSTK